MKTVQDIAKVSLDWYFTNMFPTSIYSPVMGRLVGSSTSFLGVLAKEAKQTNFYGSLEVEDIRNGGVAYADLVHDRMVVGKVLFSEETYKARWANIKQEQIPPVAMSVINGCVIHEALHLIYTKDENKSWNEIVMSSSAYNEAHALAIPDKMLFNCANLIEDLFIEDQTPHVMKRFIECAWEMFFNLDDLQKFTKKSMAAETLFNTCIMYKNAELRETIRKDLKRVGLTDITKILNKVLNASKTYWDIDRRLMVAFELAKEFDILFPTDELEEIPEFGDGHHGNSPIDVDVADGDMKLARMFDMMVDIIDHHQKKAMNDSSPINFDDSGVTWKDVVELDIYDARRTDSRMSAVGDYDFGFVAMLQTKMSDNRAIGHPREFGSRMVKSRLHRVDKKVFAKRDNVKLTKKRKEIIILADWSGSIRGNGCGERELATLLEMSKTLPQARIPFGIYAHTTQYAGYGDTSPPLLVHVASRGLTINNVDIDQRLEALRTLKSSQSVDGAVLEKVATKFTKKPAERFLFVLSDGEPNNNEYRGRQAEEHTEKVVNQLRAQGIHVFVFSLVHGVVDNNNRIYGKEFNINGSRNLNLELRKLVESIF